MTTLRDKMKQKMTLRGFAEGTKVQYFRAVMKLYNHYNRSLAQLSEEEISTFLLSVIRRERYAASTYNVMIHGLKFFYEAVLNRPMVAVQLPRLKEPQKLPDILGQEEVEQIIKATLHLKHRTMLIMIYGAGLRAFEAASLRVLDIDRKRHCIHIRDGKGKKDRYVPLSPLMLCALEEYWKKCRLGDVKKENDLIFPGARGEILSVGTISALYKKSKSLAGIKKQGGVHALRHAFATHTLEAGANVYAIQQILGHASISSTVRYLRMTDKTLQMVESPIERLKL